MSATQGAWECRHGVDGRDWCDDCHSPVPPGHGENAPPPKPQERCPLCGTLLRDTRPERGGSRTVGICEEHGLVAAYYGKVRT